MHVLRLLYTLFHYIRQVNVNTGAPSTIVQPSISIVVPCRLSAFSSVAQDSFKRNTLTNVPGVLYTLLTDCRTIRNPALARTLHIDTYDRTNPGAKPSQPGLLSAGARISFFAFCSDNLHCQMVSHRSGCIPRLGYIIHGSKLLPQNNLLQLQLSWHSVHFQQVGDPKAGGILCCLTLASCSYGAEFPGWASAWELVNQPQCQLNMFGT